MNGPASFGMAAGLASPVVALITGNVAATLEPRPMSLWLMVAPLLLSATACAVKLLEPGAQGT